MIYGKKEGSGGIIRVGDEIEGAQPLFYVHNLTVTCLILVLNGICQGKLL
jgi:hypothetical protein